MKILLEFIFNSLLKRFLHSFAFRNTFYTYYRKWKRDGLIEELQGRIAGTNTKGLRMDTGSCASIRSNEEVCCLASKMDRRKNILVVRKLQETE
jgi:hypothetical protein